MSFPLVSVIMPCYNHEKFVREALESVVKSEYPAIEILIIDDGSKDNSCSVIESFIEENKNLNIIFRKQQNQGVCKTLNSLITLSKGEYIALLASDDKLLPQGIMDRVTFLENNKNCDIVIGRANVIDNISILQKKDAATEMYRASDKLLNSKFVNEELILRWSVVGPVTMIRKSAYNKYGKYDESLKGEDRDFFLRVLANRAVGFCNTYVAQYRVHDSNASVSRKSRNVTRIECAKLHLKYSHLYEKKIARFLNSYQIDIKLLEKESMLLYYLFKGLRDIIVLSLYRNHYYKILRKESRYENNNAHC